MPLRRSLLPPRIGVPAVGLALCLAAAGCASGGGAAAVKEPLQLDITVAAATRVNVDEQGRAAPLQVRVYELKSPAAFEAADYFGLAGNDKAVLQGDLLARQDYLLRPGETQRLRRASHPQATVIGVLAGYRDLPANTWRAVHLLPEAPDASWMRAVLPSSRVRLKVLADDGGLSVQLAD